MNAPRRAGRNRAAGGEALLLAALRAESARYQHALQAARAGRQGDIHDLRIATRRMLALMEFAAALAPSGKWAPLAREIRRPFRKCARLRDLQMARARLRQLRDGSPAQRVALCAWLEWLNEAVRRHRHRATAQLAGARPRRTCRKILHLARARFGTGSAAAIVRGRMDHSRRGVRAACRRMRKGGFEALHRVRVAIKVCRYQLELAAALGFAAPPDELRTLRRLQKALGAVTDLELLRRECKRFARRQPGHERALARFRRRLDHELEQGRARALAAAGRGDIVAAPVSP